MPNAGAAPEPIGTEPAELSARARTWTLVAACLTPAMVATDTLAVAVALPAMESGLDLSSETALLAVNAFVLADGAMIVASGRLADLFGRRRMFIIGSALFVVASVLVGVAWTGWFLVFARALEGVGAALCFTSSLALVADAYPPEERGRAIGWWGTAAGAGLGLGPILAGILIAVESWRLVFFLSAPVGIAAIFLAQRFARESRDTGAGQHIDYAGLMLIAGGVSALTLAILEGSNWGWASPSVLILFLIGAALTGVFIVVELRVTSPLVDLTLFRNRNVVGASVLALLILAVAMTFMVYGSLYLQRVRGLSALQAGLAFLPFTIAFFTSSQLSGRIVSHIGARTPILLGGVVTFVGAVAVTQLDGTTPAFLVAMTFLVLGAGIPLVWTPIGVVALDAVPSERAGMASGINLTCRMFGGSLGVAAGAAILGNDATGRASPAEFLDGFRSVMWFVSALAVGCLLTALLTISPATSRPKQAL